jgi:hypothetical protein
MLASRPYPRRLIKTLYSKYVKQDRIPLPSTLEGKSKWIVAKVIKKDVKSLSKWSSDPNNKYFGPKPKKIAERLLELYLDASDVMKENGNERCDYYLSLRNIIEFPYAVETKTCEHTGQTMYCCPECKDWDYDDLNGSMQCRVCWEMENHPETFELTETQIKEWNEASDYVMKHKLSPNLDHPES